MLAHNEGNNMRHKNADMIIAKASDMSLVLIGKVGGRWIEIRDDALPIREQGFYLCHRKHKDPCLAWLKGSSVQCRYIAIATSTWNTTEPEDDPKWTKQSVFMCDHLEIRIKPKKEKRWIAIKGASNSVIDIAYKSKEELLSGVFSGGSANASGWQFIEIEVEV